MRRTDWSTCSCGKRAWKSEDAAERALGEAKVRAKNARRGAAWAKRNQPERSRIIRRQERRVYECEWSGLWHLTSKENAA